MFVCAVYQSSSVDFSEKQTREFLESYQDRRFSSQYLFLKMLTLDEVISIVAFRCSIIKPVVWYYTGRALDNFAEETTKDPQSHVPLSKIEETRLVRAMYRFQFYHNLFCHDRHDYQRLEFEDMDTVRILMGIYQPWEVEEIAWIHTFAIEKFNQVFNYIYWDVHQENPKFVWRTTPSAHSDGGIWF